MQAPQDPETAFRLLVKAPSTNPSRSSLALGDHTWNRLSYATPPTENPRYLCVSYAWGNDRILSPLDTGHSISIRAIPALNTLLQYRLPEAVWLDAFCVPLEEPLRSACLMSMGAIYARASEVVVVLSPECGPLLRAIHDGKAIGIEALRAFEQDPWISRAWTYQEVANSGTLIFLAEGSGGFPVPGQDLLNRVGEASLAYGRQNAYRAFELREKLPRTDALEDLLADWQIHGYQERSAYQAMSAMIRREAEQPGDRIWAMMGTISESPSGSLFAVAGNPVEHFMQACESKGDFSFLFSSEPRGRVPGRGWRPAGSQLTPVFPWHTFGEGQPGQLHPAFLRLDKIALLLPSPIREEARKDVLAWLQVPAPELEVDLPKLAWNSLRQVGFPGQGRPVETEWGYFLPLLDPLPSGMTVAVSTGLRFAGGSLGMLVRMGDSGNFQFHSAGVFLGRVPKESGSIGIS